MKTFLLNTGKKINGFLLLLLLLLFSFQNISAQRVASVSGNWNNTATWGGAAIPTSANSVVINAGITVTVILAANAASLIVNGTLNITGANLTIANGGSVTNNSGGSIVFNATNVINGGGNGANGILIAINSGSSLTTANANGFNSSTGSFQHNFGNRSQTYSPGANFTYNGTVAQNTGTSYPTALTGSLTINNSNGVTLTDAARTITTGTLNLVAGIFNTIPVATNRLSIGSTATINRSGGSIAGTLQGTGVYNLTYTGNSKTSGPEAANTGLNNVTVNLTAAQALTWNSTGVAPDGNLSISAGILDLGSNSINRSAAGGTLTVSNGATLKIGGTNTLTLNYNTHSIGSSSTVEYSGTSQTVAVINSSQNYGNLTLSGSGTKTVAGAITASGTTTVNSGVTFATGVAFTANGAVAINGTFQINQGGFGGGSGTWTYGSNTNLIYNYTQTTFYGPVDATHKYWPAISGPTNVTLQMQNNASLDAGELRMGVARTITGALTSTNANGRTMTFNLNGNNFQSASLTVGTTAPLTLLSTAVTTVTGNININADFAINGDLSVGGNWTKSASGITFIRNSKAVFFTGSGTTQTVTITGGGTETFDYLLIDKASAGSVQLGSATNITIAANTANTFEIKTSASSLDLNGNTLNLSASGGNIYANSVAASIIGGSGSKIVVSGGIKNFINTQPADTGSWIFAIGVTLEASTGVNFGMQTTVNGTFKILSGGFVSGNTAPFYANGSTLEISTGGTFSLYDNGGSNESGGWFRNTASTGSTQRGVPWNFTISGNTTVNYNSVADANPRYSNGNIDIQSGSFFTLGGSAGGNLFVKGNFSRGGTFTPNSRLVTFDGTSSQTINNATTFYDLSNTNTASPLILGAIMTVTNNLSIASSAFLNLGSFIHTADSLTLNGSAQGTGSSYGGTASPAATISAFFTNTTGVVNIGTCGNYSLTSTAAATAICTGGFATINLANSIPANLPDGIYQVFYTLGAPNAASGSASMTISGGTGTGSFTTASPLATSGPTSITIDYIRSGCVSIISVNKTATIVVNVVPLGPVIAKVPTDATVCVGLTLTISVTTAGTGGAISPQDEYRFSTDNGSSWSNWGTSLPSFAAVTGTNIVESQRTSAGSGCSTAAANTVSWSVNAVPVGPVIAKDPNVTEVCVGAILAITLTTAGTGGAVTSQDEYRFSIDNGSNWSSWGTSLPSFAAVVGTNIVESQTTSTGSGCTTASGNTVSWTVVALSVAGALTPTGVQAAVCAGATVSATATAGTGGTGTILDELEVSLSNGSYAAYNSGDSISTTGETSVNIRTRRTATGNGCSSSGYNTVSWTVNAVLVGPVIAKVPTDATVCAGQTLTISVTTAGTGGAISPQDEYRYDDGSGFSAWSISIPSFTAVAGTNTIESRRTSTGSGCSTAAGNTVSWTVSNANTWIGGTSTAWNNALNWSCGIVPIPATDVTIGTSTNDPIITSNVAINSLIINLGETLTVNSNYDLAVSDVIANTGTLTIENNSNLLQTNNVANTGSGSTIVKRGSAPIKRLDYTLWSSPVTGQGLYSFSPTTLSNRFYVYNPELNSYSNSDVGFNLTNLQYPSPLVAPIGINGTDSANIPFVPARGYLIRMPWNHPTAPTVWNGTFIGVPNNGTISMPLTDYGIGKRYNLIGNPYPSAIDVETFIQTNIDNGSITGTVYFYRKTNGALNGSYCTYNLGGFLGNGESILDLPQYGEDFENIVQVGQGFFVERKEVSTGSVVFTNDMRISSNVNRFFKTTNMIERNRIWLNVTNATGSFSQAMIAYITGATQGVDIAIDGKLFTDGAVALASLIGTDAYAIQGRALPFDVSDVVPLSLKVTTAGTYTITIDHVDGLFTNNSQTIYLRDLATGSVHNLSAGGYNFTTDAGTFDIRFEIIYQAASLGTLTFNESQVVIYKTPTNEISINTGNVVMSMVKIFDIRGRLLQEQKNINASQTAMSVGVANEILLVQITSEEGIVVTKKVIR